MKSILRANSVYVIVTILCIGCGIFLIIRNNRDFTVHIFLISLLVFLLVWFLLVRVRHIYPESAAKEKYSEDILNQYFTYSNDMLCIADQSGYFRMLNPEWEKTLGFTKEELMKKPYISFVHPDDVEPTIRAANNLSEQSNVHGFINRYRCKDGSYKWLEWHSYPKDDLIFAAVRDISEHRSIEEELARNENRLNSIVSIMQYPTGSIKELLDFALEEAIKLTQSKIGYIYHYNEERRQFTLNSWSKDVMDECSVQNPQTTYMLEETGLWGEAVRQRIPVLVNDYAGENPYKKGYPEGHSVLNNFLAIPIFSGDKVVATIGVANKQADYNNTDILQLKLLMEATWKVIEAKKATDELRTSEQMLSDIYNLSPYMVGIARQSDGNILTANPATTRVTGYTPEEYLNRSAFELNWWADEEDLKKMLLTLQEKGEIINQEIKFRLKSGEIITTLSSAKHIFYNNEPCLIFVISDISELKKAQKLIADERNILRAVVDNIPDIVYVKDSECRFVITNQAHSRILGKSVEDLIGHSDKELHPNELAQEFLQDEQMILQTGIPIINKEETIYDSAGNKVIIQTTKLPLRDSTGSIYGIVGSGHIITEQKKAEEEIRQLNRALEKKVEERTAKLHQAYKELESFSYSISHDLRSPLRHVDGFVRLMIANINAPNEAVRDYSEKLLTVLKRMATMIDDLLAFSRLGRKELVLRDINLDSLIREIIDQLKPDTGIRDISWIIHPLPPVRGDYSLLRLAFENLLSNAIKYTSGKSKAKIEIGTHTGVDSQEEIFIKDNGAGFDMAYAGKLFGVFQRLHSSQEFEGTGIGLANVKQIITKHNGSIRAEGIPNEGATFYITLPAWQEGKV